MANSIVSRLIRLFTARANDALDAAEDPGAIARQLIRDLSAEIARTEEAVAEVIAEHKLLASKRNDAEAEAKMWNDKAIQAVRAKSDDLATAALQRAERAERNLAAYQKSLDLMAPKVDALKSKLADLRRKKDDAESDADVLAARATAAKATKQAARILGGVGDNPIDFDSVRDRVARLEAQAEALDEVAAEKSGSRLADKLDALGGDGDKVSDRLAALKAEHGVPNE